jgi:DNA-binding SARP family transcriptional activator
MDYRLLGRLQVRANGVSLEVGGARPRALLADLLLHANRVVSSDRLIEDVWGDDTPEHAVHDLRVVASRLRARLGTESDVLQTLSPGYRLVVSADELDLARFERLTEEVRHALAAGEADLAARRLGEALELWRGEPLADLWDASFVLAERARLDELHLAALEDRIEAELAIGRHAQVVDHAGALVRSHPFRERLRGHLALALYRCGRQADALEVLAEGRWLLGEELGVDPHPALVDLERRILLQEPTLDPHAPIEVSNASLPEAFPVAVRKGVVVLFAEVASDPSEGTASRRATERALDRIGVIVERRGAAVGERGDADLTAWFGMPRLHEDDAVRAADAARTIIRSVRSLGRELGTPLAARVGIDVVEVVAEPGAALEYDRAAVSRLARVAAGEEALMSTAVRDRLGRLATT